jgi:N-acetylated-alpha-linked acidic dipeptidase
MSTRRVVRAVTLLLACVPVLAAAQSRMPGFSSAATARQRELEREIAAGADAATMQRHERTLSGWARVAGSPGSRSAAEYVLREFASYGLDTVRAEFEVYLPHQDSAAVELVRPAAAGGTLRLALEEPPVAGDEWSRTSAWPVMNGQSGVGDVTSRLVYVNRGLADDYRVLDSLGVDVQGAVVIARYGGGFRGIKAREAERRGAAALLLYSDPADDGYVQGDVYPLGPMRSPDGVQRGSLFNGDGDPSTPTWSSAESRRLREDSLDVTHIPVVPLGYGNAERLLSTLRTGAVPQSWQGGLPFRYHTGPGESQVRVAVWAARGARALRTIVDALGVLRGAEFPDELVLIGAHRDSWGPGAADNASGTTSVLEAARLLGAAAGAGARPRRTVVFATWDAEEWGLVGSTEWGERESARLMRDAVAYVNQDMSAFGTSFGAEASPTLAALLREAAATVGQPGENVTVYDAWRRRTRQPDSLPPVGDLTGGSDFAVFYNHLGIASVGFGFGGPMGVYHSAYDTPTFMERFGDPGYLAHRAAATLSAVLVSRLANADVVPYDFEAFGRKVAAFAAQVRKQPGAASVDLAAIERLAAEVTKAGAEVATARERALTRGDLPPARLVAANAALRRAERSLTVPGGIPGRPWMQNVLLATDRDNGYGSTPLPGISEALVDGDTTRATAQTAVVAEGLGRAKAALREAAATLK